MNLDRIPILGNVLASGAEDRIFDGLMVIGPVLIIAIAILGRSIATVGLATMYIAVFVGYVVYKGTVD